MNITHTPAANVPSSFASFLISSPCFQSDLFTQVKTEHFRHMAEKGYNMTEADLEQHRFLCSAMVLIEKRQDAETLHIEWVEGESLATVLKFKNLPFSVYSFEAIPVDPFQSHTPCFLQHPSISKQIANRITFLLIKDGNNS